MTRLRAHPRFPARGPRRSSARPAAATPTDVPADAIAVVDGNTIDKTEFDELIAQAEKSYKAAEARLPEGRLAGVRHAEEPGRPVPRAARAVRAARPRSSTSRSRTSRSTSASQQIKKQYFGAATRSTRDQLKQQGLTEEQRERDIRAQLVQEKIFTKVPRTTQGHRRGDPGLLHEEQGAVRDAGARDVRHILVTTKKQADTHLHSSCRTAATSPRSRRSTPRIPAPTRQGGKLTIARGQTVRRSTRSRSR